MKINSINIDLNKTVENWNNLLFENANNNDFILLSHDIDSVIWFISNYTQYLIGVGKNEVVTLYGELIKNLQTFIYQLNYSLPVGYKLRVDHHALYDLLLNFETEPAKRLIIWNDAHFLFDHNRAEFETIFELMIVAGYCNREGVSTIKENGMRYQIDQRNFFIFVKKNMEDLKYLFDKEYYIPSIDEQFYKEIEFNIVEIDGK